MLASQQQIPTPSPYSSFNDGEETEKKRKKEEVPDHKLFVIKLTPLSVMI